MKKYLLIFYALRRSYDKIESSHQSSKKSHFKFKNFYRATIRVRHHLTHLLWMIKSSQKMFENIFNLKKEHNKERNEKENVCICFSFHKKRHTIHDYILIFPHKKKQNFERIGVMLAISNHFERKKRMKEIHLTLL
jgi:uncharacterized protein YkuJ